jgi:hypothetical protein
MILGKNKTLQKQYQTDCYDRDEFFNILSIDNIIGHSSYDHGQKETFSDFSIKNDSLDFRIYNIFYPLPLVKDIFIKNWANGWSSDQSYIHLEYVTHSLHAGKWRRRGLMKRVLTLPEEEEKIITKDQIFPEIIKFINHLDEERAKKILREFNLNQLV